MPNHNFALAQKQAVLVLLVVVLFTSMAGTTSAIQAGRSQFTLPQDQQFTNTGRQLISISPDGSQLVYVANNRLYLKVMAERESRFIAGTEIGQGVTNPVFSPDGKSIAYWSASDQTLKRIAAGGGTPVTICKAANPWGMSWGANDEIVYGLGPNGINRVSANGGTPQTIVTVKPGELAHGPQILPGGDIVLYTLAALPASGSPASSIWDKAKIVVHTLKSNEDKVLFDGGSDGRYTPTGHVVFATGGKLMAAAVNIGRLEATSKPTVILEDVRSAGNASGTSQFSFSNNGTLIYLPESAATQIQLSWVAFNGSVTPIRAIPASTFAPRISPNGKQVAYDAEGGIWISDLTSAAVPRRLTTEPSAYPIWSSDGARIVYTANHDNGQALFWRRADGSGTAELLVSPARAPESWSVSNQMFSFITLKGVSGDNGDYDIWTYSLQDKKASPFIATPVSAQTGSRFSPDGHWMAFESIETGRSEVYVQPFPGPGERLQISKNGGNRPLWSPDGTKLYFDIGGNLFSVAIQTKPKLTSSVPVQMPISGFMQARATSRREYDIAPDGKQFLMKFTPALAIKIASNWFDELKKH